MLADNTGVTKLFPELNKFPPEAASNHSVTEPAFGTADKETVPIPQRIPGVTLVNEGGLQSVLKARV